MIEFSPLQESHFLLLHKWLNEAHVQEFYSLRAWTLEEIQKKYRPYLSHSDGIHGFCIILNSQPVGYIQYFPVKYHPWPGQDFNKDVIQNGIGLDLFIGEPTFCGCGEGERVVSDFIEHHLSPKPSFCVVDPDIRNIASLKLFEKLGFRPGMVVETKNSINQDVFLQLMIKDL